MKRSFVKCCSHSPGIVLCILRDHYCQHPSQGNEILTKAEIREHFDQIAPYLQELKENVKERLVEKGLKEKFNLPD